MIHTSWILVLGLFFVSTLGNLPPYTNPGSFIATETGWQGNNTYELMIALWDASTGKNYTTVVGWNITFDSFIPNINERVIAYTYHPIQVYNHTTVVLYKYAPKQAPTQQKGSSCVLPIYASSAYPFVMQGNTYALAGNILYSLAVSSSSKTCDLTVLEPLPASYSPFCSLSMTTDHVAYISGTTLVQLWFNEKTGNFSITGQPVPEALAGTWLWLEEDSITGHFYYYSTVCCYNESFWQGTREKGNKAQNAPITWTPMQYWSKLDPGNFMLDTRYESEYGGPLFCSTDSFYDPYCWTVDSQQAWAGPHLADAFNDMSGVGSYEFYDPNCN